MNCPHGLTLQKVGLIWRCMKPRPRTLQKKPTRTCSGDKQLHRTTNWSWRCQTLTKFIEKQPKGTIGNIHARRALVREKARVTDMDKRTLHRQRAVKRISDARKGITLSYRRVVDIAKKEQKRIMRRDKERYKKPIFGSLHSFHAGDIIATKMRVTSKRSTWDHASIAMTGIPMGPYVYDVNDNSVYSYNLTLSHCTMRSKKCRVSNSPIEVREDDGVSRIIRLRDTVPRRDDIIAVANYISRLATYVTATFKLGKSSVCKLLTSKCFSEHTKTTKKYVPLVLRIIQYGRHSLTDEELKDFRFFCSQYVLLVYQVAAAIVYGPDASKEDMAPFMYNPSACRPSHVSKIPKVLGEYWTSVDLNDFHMTNWALDQASRDE